MSLTDPGQGPHWQLVLGRFINGCRITPCGVRSTHVQRASNQLARALRGVPPSPATYEYTRGQVDRRALAPNYFKSYLTEAVRSRRASLAGNPRVSDVEATNLPRKERRCQPAASEPIGQWLDAGCS